MGSASIGRRFLLLLLFVSLAFHSFSALAAENISILSPKRTHFAGQPLLFHIQPKNIVLPDKATVYYRAIGIRIFRRIPMKKETPVDFRALLKAEKVIPPGIEFFFVVQDKTGHTFTFPKLDPKKKPYSLKIDLDKQPPDILESSPAEGSSLSQTRPEIRITFKDKETKVDKKTVRISVDNTDVTQLAKITDTELSYQPPTELTHGRHTVAVEMSDVCGNRMMPQSWAFIIPRTARLQKANTEIQWDGEFRRMVSKDENNQDPSWHLQSSATLKSQLESGNFKTSLDANAWYTDEEGPGPAGDKFNLNNYLYKAQYGKQSVALGDMTVEGTELISQSIARRGSMVEMNLGETRAQGFVLRSNAITGFDHLVGVEDPEQRLVGVSLATDLIKNKALTLKGAYITGRNHNPDDYNVSTLEAGTEGDIYSIGLSSEFLKGKLNLEGEFSSGRYDSDVSDNLGKESGKAWRTKILGKGDSYDWEAGYKYLGPEFQSVVNATGANNRDEFNAGFGLRALSSNFRITALRTTDNVEEDPLIPVIRNTTGAFAYNLAKTKWPAFFLNYTLNRQDSTKEPNNYSPIKNQTQTIGGGFSMSGSRWSVSPSYTFTAFNDKSITTDNDSNTHVAVLSGSLRPTDTFSISPSVSYTNMHTDATDLTMETYQGTLGTVLSLYERMVDLNGTLSYLDNKTNDGSSHTSTFNGIAQVNWHLEKLLFDKGKQTLSLRAQYSRTEDHVSESITRDYTVFALFSFSVPVKLY